MSTGLTNNYILSFATDGTNLYTGTQGGGTWKRPLSELTGIKENTVNATINVYPNPVKENLTVETNSNTEQRLEILNLIGQTIYTTYINKKATINTSVFAKGVYILKLSSDKETVVRKFIKE